MMIWQIFRKDLWLLWPLAVLVAALEVCAAIPHHLTDMGVRSAQLALVADLLSMLALLGVGVAVIVLMHQDAVPGLRQDWLTRPIRRGDLIVAKLLFVLLMVMVPLWLVDLGAALADGFDFSAACVAASAHNLAVLCKFALPAMMIGAITRSFVEAFVVVAVGMILYIICFQILLAMLLGVRVTVAATGARWMFDAAYYAMAILGAATILPLQYFARRTGLSRALIGLGGAAVIFCAFMPWHFAFGLQRALSAEPLAARDIQLQFNPHLGRYEMPRGAAPNLTAALFLPLRAMGVPDGDIVLLDLAQVRVTAVDGTTLYQGRTNISVDGLGSMLDAQFEIRAGRQPGPADLYQRIYLPAQVRGRVADRPVRIAVDYSLTLLRPAAPVSVPAIGGDARLGDLGRCATGIDPEGDDVEISCLSALRQPTCFSARLEDAAAGLRNPEFHSCMPLYGPLLISQLYPDAINRVGGELRFFDRSGMTRFPIDGSKLAQSRLTIQTYVPIDHFTRHVDSPVLRLADLTGAAAAGTEPPAP
jgi:hypothetical protein